MRFDWFSMTTASAGLITCCSERAIASTSRATTFCRQTWSRTSNSWTDRLSSGGASAAQYQGFTSLARRLRGASVPCCISSPVRSSRPVSSRHISSERLEMKKPQPVGALVVGGDHPGLGVVRSLGRRGIPVYVVDDQPTITSCSRYVERVVRVSDLRDDRRTVDSILEVGQRFGLRNWVLFPTRDETVAAFARHRSELA